MSRRCLAVAFAVVFTCLLPPVAGAAPGGDDRLDVYTSILKASQLGELDTQGVDLSVRKRVADGFEAQLILTADERARLARAGVDTKLTRVKGGKTVKQFAAAQAANGFNVWRSWDEAGGIRDQMYAIARKNPDVVKLVKLGTTLNGREILALKVTQGARGKKDGSRPAVLFSSTQHARE